MMVTSVVFCWDFCDHQHVCLYDFLLALHISVHLSYLGLFIFILSSFYHFLDAHLFSSEREQEGSGFGCGER